MYHQNPFLGKLSPFGLKCSVLPKSIILGPNEPLNPLQGKLILCGLNFSVLLKI